VHTVLLLPAATRAELEMLAGGGYPDETCGLLLGREESGRCLVVGQRAARNVNRERSRDRFEVDPLDFLAAENAATAAGLAVVGCWHSHPDHPARPSETDRVLAWPGWSYVIVAVTAAGVVPERGHVIMLGGDMIGLDLARTLIDTRHRVTLVAGAQTFWPHEVADEERPGLIAALEKLGIELRFRPVDFALYQQRLRTFGFDITSLAFGGTHNPGPEYADLFGSAAADTQDSGNMTGIRSAAVDALISRMVGAAERDDFLAACRALDRVIMHSHVLVPQWSAGTHRMVYNAWRLARPDRMPPYATGELWAIDTWWKKP